jgi:uncharacterized protein YkwD
MWKSTLTFVAVLSLLALGACEPAGTDPGAAAANPEAAEAVVPDFGSVDGNETVRIFGAEFGEDPTVTIGGAPVSEVRRISDTELEVVTPPGVEGEAEVVVTGRNGEADRLACRFSFQDPLLAPALSSLSPAEGFVAGGTLVTLKGARFQDGATITFQGFRAPDVVVQDDETITVFTPAGMPTGALDVVVENHDGRKASLQASFTAVGLTPREAEVLERLNEVRAKEGLHPLRVDLSLLRAARDHTRDMIERDFFDHINPDGLAFWDRARAQGYPSSYIGENLAAGYLKAADAMAGWMESPGHRANILNPDFEEIGIGMLEGGSMGAYWTQVFGTP